MMSWIFLETLLYQKPHNMRSSIALYLKYRKRPLKADMSLENIVPYDWIRGKLPSYVCKHKNSIRTVKGVNSEDNSKTLIECHELGRGDAFKVRESHMPAILVRMAFEI